MTWLKMIRDFSCHPVRLIKHTKKLMDKEEKLCIKILQTLREMLDKKECFQETVSTWRHTGSTSLKQGFHSIICDFLEVRF